MDQTAEIRVPFSLFREDEISLTYPDSILSFVMIQKKDDPEFNPEYHGKVFTLREMESLITRRGLPVTDWTHDEPPNFSHYLEVQMWNQKVLDQYFDNLDGIF